MRGISSTGKDQIKGLVERFFDKISAKLLGSIPSLRNKNLFFSSYDLSLTNIFIQAMDNKHPNELEQDVLKGLLSSSLGYLDAIKHNTQSNVAEQVDGLIRQSQNSNRELDPSEINEILQREFNKAKSAVKTIAESEGTKVRNVGSAMDISRLASERGIEDPNVFFIVIRDKSTCKWCLQNHLHGNGTPKVFKLSEIKQSYLSTEQKKTGEVSVCGLHPFCRCTLGYLAPGFGFKRGKLEYISQYHDEYKHQKS